jgi:hypothetical protein
MTPPFFNALINTIFIMMPSVDYVTDASSLATVLIEL